MSSFRCPLCDGEAAVKDSRPTNAFPMPAIRRRRACVKCKYRFTTFELAAPSEHGNAVIETVSEEITSLIANMHAGIRFLERMKAREAVMDADFREAAE